MRAHRKEKEDDNEESESNGPKETPPGEENRSSEAVDGFSGSRTCTVPEYGVALNAKTVGFSNNVPGENQAAGWSEKASASNS